VGKGYRYDVGGGNTVKLLLLYLHVYNATKPQIRKSQNRKSHGSAEFRCAKAGNDISVTHRARAEAAARQLGAGERSGRAQPSSSPPAPLRPSQLRSHVPVPSLSNEGDVLYLAPIFLVTRFEVLVASCMEKQCNQKLKL